jgi:Fe-S-cluster containining protein
VGDKKKFVSRADLGRHMNRNTLFSYQCNQCGRCCHDQVITLSPYDVIRIARSAGVSTGEAVAQYTIRRGSILKFEQDGSCAALDGTKCTLHSGRPLACRLYPLGLEHHQEAVERYARLEPALGSRGCYGTQGTIHDFLASQAVDQYFEMNRRYTSLLDIFRQRIAELADFDTIEPREFWRVAVREALAENSFDFNQLIEALFDPDSLAHCVYSELEFVEHHVARIEQLIRHEQDPAILASAAILLAVSLGYSPGDVMVGRTAMPSC